MTADPTGHISYQSIISLRPTSSILPNYLNLLYVYDFIKTYINLRVINNFEVG